MPDWIRDTPILGAFLRYLNLYVGRGEIEYFSEIAPRHLWLERFFLDVSKCAILTAIVWLGLLYLEALHRIDAAGLVNSVFPSLLGFGIGVFALIFVLPGDLMSSLDKRRAKSGIGSSMMISDMAYPLVYLAFGLVAATLTGYLVSSPVSDFIQLFIFLYGLSLVCDLIGVIAAAALAARSRQSKATGYLERDKLLKKLRRGKHTRRN